MKTELREDGACWYAIQTHLKQEDRAYCNLAAWGLRAFSPRLREGRRNQFTGAVTYFSKPMFSRYIFARFDAASLLHKICYTRGVKNVVCFGGSPVPIDDEVIAMLQARVGADGYVKLGEELKHGDRIVITGGPLKDFAGVFERGMKDSERVMVLLTTISYQGSFSVGKEMVRKVA
ncbi:MAG TPA: transcription termination/antitermination NusG family protein [Pyrinomonadaceae bacterium]|jgi:transcriptional antiterminator RfaH